MKSCTCTSPGTRPAADNYNTIGSCEQPACSLHTIIIPKHKGTDAPGQPFAPTLGAYQNTVLVFEGTGSVYIFDEAGVFTNLTGSEVLRVVTEVQKELQATTENVTILGEKLATETELRVAAQTALQAALEALQGALDAEADTRKAEDEKLNTALNSLQSKVTDLGNAGSTETTDREAAISDLQGKIDNLTADLEGEASTRAEADTKLSTDVENLRTAVENLGGEIEGDAGKIANLPDTVLQSVAMNGSDNAINLQTSGTKLADGTPVVSADTVNLKTINGETILGEGDIKVSAPTQDFKTVNNETITGTGNISVQAPLVSGTNIKTVNGTSILGSGDIVTLPSATYVNDSVTLTITSQTTTVIENVPFTETGAYLFSVTSLVGNVTEDTTSYNLLLNLYLTVAGGSTPYLIISTPVYTTGSAGTGTRYFINCPSATSIYTVNKTGNATISACLVGYKTGGSALPTVSLTGLRVNYCRIGS